MSRWGKLISLVRAGALLMVFGNALVTALQFKDSNWKYMVYIFPANLGQGIVYPGLLFTGLATFQHSGKSPPHAVSWQRRADFLNCRPRCFRISDLSSAIDWVRDRSRNDILDRANHAHPSAPGCFG